MMPKVPNQEPQDPIQEEKKPNETFKAFVMLLIAIVVVSKLLKMVSSF